MNNMFMYRLGQKRGGGGSSAEEWIGDGNTHIWISLPEGRTSPMLGVGVNGTVTVDWGDGSEPDTLTGTSTSTTVWTSNHEYGKAGDYVITLTVDGNMCFRGGKASDAHIDLLRHSSTADGRNNVYRLAIQRIEVGGGVVELSSSAFYHVNGLTNVKFVGNDVTAFRKNAFQYCYRLRSIDIPNKATTIETNAFTGCHSLTSVHFPSTVASLGSSMFQNCSGLVYCDFSKHTVVPTLPDVVTFQGVPQDFQIRVPAALVDEWKAATNWSTYADNIVGV